MKIKIYFLLLFPGAVLLHGQEGGALLRGKVTDATTKKPISLVSVLFPGEKNGTITDTLGFFSLSVKERTLKDTLVISYLGYEEKRIPLSYENPFLNIELQQENFRLDAVEVREYGPIYYLDKAMAHAVENYSKTPYNIISFLETKIYEDNKFLMGTESVFRSYYRHRDFPRDPNQQHQIVLYKNIDSTHKLKFMKDRITKGLKRKNGDPDFVIRLTPDFIPVAHNVLPFLNKDYYKKFSYTLRETCSKRNLIIIDFYTKRSFSYNHAKFRGHGTIYIDCDNYAIAKLDIDMDIELSFLAKSIVFITFGKLKVNKGKIAGSIEYKPIDGIWYPYKLSLQGGAKATKFRWFAKNEKAYFDFQSNVLVNRIITDSVSEIPQKKRFSFSKLNLHNDMNMSWDDINRLYWTNNR